MMLPLLLSLVVSVTDDPPVKVWLNHDNYFQRGDHWDYRVLDARQAGEDKEAALVEMVQRMTPEGHFDYDAVTYAVASARAYYDSYYPHYAVNFGYGWGWPYGYRYAALYSTCYDPFFYDPFLCYDPIFYRPYGYGFYGYGFYGYRYRPYYGGGEGFFKPSRQLVIKRVRTGTGGQMYFKDPLRSNAAASGGGPRVPVPPRAPGAPRGPHPPPRRRR